MDVDVKDIPVVILCGGQGTRIREESERRPKPMIEIGERPILWHVMKIYAAHGFRNFVLCLGYKGHVIRDYFLNYRAYSGDVTVSLASDRALTFHDVHGEQDWRVTLVETGEETQTGGRVARAARYLLAPRFCLTYGDGVGNIDVAALLAFHRDQKRVGTITGVRPPGRFGELSVGNGNQVRSFNEKPQVSEGFINGGFMVFERTFVETYLSSSEGTVLEQEPLRKLAADGQLSMFSHGGFWQPMDTYREFKILNDLWRSGRAPWKVW